MNWRSSVNQSSASVSITDVSGYVVTEPAAQTAPIDLFYLTASDILRAATPKLVQEHPAVAALFLVGLVSATENYVRDILARIIAICPIAQKASSGQKIDLGSVVWNSAGGQIERGAFEHLSLAGSKNVRETCQKFVEYQISESSPAGVALSEFDKICELRHCLVHAGAFVAGKNAVALQLPRTGDRLRVKPDFARIQECGSVCTTLVTSLNTQLFEQMVKRWAKNWRSLPSWDAADAHKRFMSIWDAFYSTRDAAAKQIVNPISALRCRNAAAKELT